MSDDQPVRTYNPLDLLPPKEAGRVIHKSVGTLANHRTLGTGPEYVKLGRIYYQYQSLLDFIERSKRKSTSEELPLNFSAVIRTNPVTK